MEWKKITLIGLASLFLQILHWVLYQALSLSAGWLALTPLLLCAAYHTYQSDRVENRGIRRIPVFFGSVILPLCIGVLTSVGFFLYNPDMALYHPNLEMQGGIAETGALYGGRVTLTSAYLLAFAGIDVFLLKIQDRRRERKS